MPQSLLIGVILSMFVSVPVSAQTDAPGNTIPESTLELGGTTYRVHWQDGDSFRVLNDEGLKTRVTQFNTLESYGPVHRWGEWKAEELQAIANQATEFASRGSWNCSFVRDGMSRKKDGYGRNLVRCDDLALALVREGLAHVLLFKNEKADELVQAQQEAIQNKRGMWKKGNTVRRIDEPAFDCRRAKRPLLAPV